MFKKFVSILGGDPNKRQVDRIAMLVDETNQLEPAFEALDDAALRRKTDEFRQRLADGEERDDLLPEAFAAVREASKRTIGLRHFDVQLIGGTVLHQGKIAEMRTGEGKTLVATLPLYLNALDGQRRPPDHGERLPGPPRCPLDGADIQHAGAERRRAADGRPHRERQESLHR